MVMNDPAHHVDIERYVVRDFSPAELRAVEAHLGSCPPCHDEAVSLMTIRDALEGLPPEILLEGPPADGDLLLQRTLRQVRHERRQGATRQLLAGIAAVVVLVASAVGVGVVVGRGPLGGSDSVASPAPTTQVPGTQYATGEGTNTPARMTVAVIPAAGWVRIQAAVSGIPKGEPCRLVVVARDGTRQVAGAWLVSDTIAEGGVTLDGSALIDPEDVAAVLVENTDGKRYVTAEL
jgi:anti-sigma factor RsiW